VRAEKEHSARGTGEPKSWRPERESSSAQYTNSAVFLCGTRCFVHGNQRSDCPSSRDVPYRGFQNMGFWPYPGQNTDIIQNMSQNIRP